jgi:hypothetical protein
MAPRNPSTQLETDEVHAVISIYMLGLGERRGTGSVSYPYRAAWMAAASYEKIYDRQPERVH